MRRAPAEDIRRGDGRPDISKRLDNFGDKARDQDRYRDDGSFGRGDNMGRQKERLAPARSNPMRQAPHPHSGSQMTPQDRDRGMMDRSGGNGNRYEPRHNRPLLLLPPGVSVDQQKGPPPAYKGHQEERGLRYVNIN